MIKAKFRGGSEGAISPFPFLLPEKYKTDFHKTSQKYVKKLTQQIQFLWWNINLITELTKKDNSEMVAGCVLLKNSIVPTKLGRSAWTATFVSYSPKTLYWYMSTCSLCQILLVHCNRFSVQPTVQLEWVTLLAGWWELAGRPVSGLWVRESRLESQMFSPAVPCGSGRSRLCGRGFPSVETLLSTVQTHCMQTGK